MHSKLRRAFHGFYLGDAFGKQADFKTAIDGNTLDIVNSNVWTENGDIVALMCITIIERGSMPLADRIAKWRIEGIKSINKPSSELSTVAAKIVDNPNWRRDPTGVVAELATAEHLTTFNLPVATAIGLVNASPDTIQKYAGLFVNNQLAGCIAIFYTQVLKYVCVNVVPSPEEALDYILPTLPILLDADLLKSYLHETFAELSVTSRPVYVMTTAKVICYALRVVSYAQNNGRTPDVQKVLRKIAAAGGDASTNCAVALSIIYAAEYVADPNGFADWWLEMENRLWITEIVDACLCEYA